MFDVRSAANTVTQLIGGWIVRTYSSPGVFYFLAAVMLATNVVIAMLPKSNAASSVRTKMNSTKLGSQYGG